MTIRVVAEPLIRFLGTDTMERNLPIAEAVETVTYRNSHIEQSCERLAEIVGYIMRRGDDLDKMGDTVNV